MKLTKKCRDVANYIIEEINKYNKDKSLDQQVVLGTSRLEKLLYICDVEYMVRNNGKPMFKDEFYSSLAGIKVNGIDEIWDEYTLKYACNLKPKYDGKPVKLSKDIISTIDMVLRLTNHLWSTDLTDIIEVQGGPYYLVYNEKNLSRQQIISKKEIFNYYKNSGIISDLDKNRIIGDDNSYIEVLFFRHGKSYYYKFNNQVYELSAISINKLKENLNLPFKVSFNAMTRDQIGRIIKDLLDITMDVHIEKINNEKDKTLKFEATFTPQKRYVEVYKVPNISSLYGRNKNCNPFLYTTINSNKVLLEVSKDFAKNNTGDYYFLASDLLVEEKEFFDSLYTKIQSDHVYKFEKNLDVENSKQKIKF